MGQIWFQNLSIAIQAVRLDRFCCPIALTIAVKKKSEPRFCRTFFAITCGYYF